MLTKKAHKHLKGCAEVEAVVDTQMGNSETYIKKGSKGYITSGPNKRNPGKCLIFWPHLEGPIPGTNLHYNDSFRQACHNFADIKFTGERLK